MSFQWAIVSMKLIKKYEYFHGYKVKQSDIVKECYIRSEVIIYFFLHFIFYIKKPIGITMGDWHHNKTIYVGILVRLLIIIQYNFTANVLNYYIQAANFWIKIPILKKNDPQTTILLKLIDQMFFFKT